jgi:CelD/BcsL family acetyltransferase involved in cellulose biosynthesis
MHHVREINDIDALAEYREGWSRLLAETPGATFFQSYDWLAAWWRHFGRRQKIRALLVWEDWELVGILPLVVLREWTKLGCLRVLTYPLASWGSYYGPIGPWPAETLNAALAHVRLTRRDWDFVELRYARDAPEESDLTMHAMRRVGWRPDRTVFGATGMVDLAGTWTDYWSSRTSKWRNNFRRWERRLAEKGEIAYLRVRPERDAGGDVDPRWDVYDQCERVAARSWQATSRDGTTLSSESVRPFLRDAHEGAARAGAVDMNLLTVGGQPAAFAYAYHFQGRVIGIRVGFDPAVADDGVGNLLYARMIEDSFHRGDEWFDLGPGSIEAKRHVVTRVENIYRYSHYPRTAVRAQLLRLKRWARGIHMDATP